MIKDKTIKSKDRLKRKIDEMPNELVEKVYQYLEEITKSKKTKNKLRAYKLKGQFDDINIRENAYE